MTAPTTQIYQVFIKASPERIWDAIVNPDRTEHYFHGSRIEITAQRRISRGPDGTLRGDGWVAEYDPPRRLVHEWRPMYNPDLAREESSRVTWEIEPHEDGYCKLTLTHDNLEGAPRTAQHVSGEGWMFVLSGLKTLVETGGRLDGANVRTDAPAV